MYTEFVFNQNSVQDGYNVSIALQGPQYVELHSFNTGNFVVENIKEEQQTAQETANAVAREAFPALSGAK